MEDEQRTPEVSIVISAYNFERYIEQAVESALRQKTERLFEVIVVDDCSTDKTAEICQMFEGKIKFFRNESNKGAAFSRNQGIKAAKGKYVLQMDGDDVIFPDALELYAHTLDKYSDIGFVYGNPEFWDEENMKSYRLECQPYSLEKLYAGEGIVICSAYMFRRKVFDVVGFYDESLKAADDHDIFLRIGEQFDVKIVPQYTMVRRMKAGGLLQRSHQSGIMLEEKKKVKFKAMKRKLLQKLKK